MLELGFEQVAIERIGLYEDEYRASWPPPCQSDSKITGTGERSVREFTRPQVGAEEGEAGAGEPATVTVPRIENAITADGQINAAEWSGANPARPIGIADDLKGQPVEARNFAWLAHDGRRLFVAFSNLLAAGQSLSGGEKWGQDDAVEVALSDPAAGENAPILVLRGFPSGHLESSNEAGAGAQLVEKAGNAVEYGAAVQEPNWWTAEYSIPLDVLGIEIEASKKLALNMTVHRAADKRWIMWNGTGGYSWRVDKAGVARLGE